jgi:hypothetical protein
MATVRVTNRLNTNYIRTRVARPGGPLENHLSLIALAVQSAAKERIRQSPERIDTGNLLNSIQIVIYYRNGMPIARIGTDVEYSVYVHEGTIYMEANPFLRDGLRRGMQQFS